MFDENKLDYLNNRDFCSFSKSSYSPVLELLVVYTKLINVNQRKESLQKDLTWECQWQADTLEQT